MGLRKGRGVSYMGLRKRWVGDGVCVSGGPASGMGWRLREWVLGLLG